MKTIKGEILFGHKIKEMMELDDLGLAIQFSEPITIDKPKQKKILDSMVLTAIKANSPFIVTRLTFPYGYGAQVIMWKENKAIRCKICRGWLNVRPPKMSHQFTHKQLGLKCES